MITRDNYEEFFLLYMDNELPVADRELVEQFVAENPDLEEEWEALLQCRIQPDRGEQPVFGHKELLMKFEDASQVGDAGKAGDAALVNDNNYEDYFLSYIDGELNERDRASVDAFVRQHPSKGLDLARLRQTISRPDPAIIFPDKESLYRAEAGRRLLISPWWRAAAAAVVLGAVGLLFLYPPAKEARSLTNGKGGAHPAATPAAPASPALAEAGAKKEGEKKEGSPVTAARATSFYSSGDSAGLAAADGARKKRTADLVARQKMMAKTVPAATAGRLPGEGTQKIAATEKVSGGEPIAIAAPDPGVRPGPGMTVDAIDRAVGSQEAVIPKEKSSFATQALLNNSTASRDDDDNFEAEPASTKKNKFRGIFRKVSRAFEKTAGREDDGQRKVLIGAFQIALK